MVGRKRRMTPSKIASAKQLLSGGMAPREVAQNQQFPEGLKTPL
jgi:hypothetical protein